MDKKRYADKEKTNVIGIIICLAIAIAVFVAVMVIQAAITNKGDTAVVVTAIENVEAPGFIKIEDADKYFKEIEVPGELAYDGVYNSLEDLFGKNNEIYVIDSIVKGEIVSETFIIGGAEFLADYENPVEMGIKVNSFENAAAGTIRRGDVVDMCILNEVGEEQMIGLYVLQAFDSSGVRIEADDTTSVAVAFTVLMERSEYVDVASIIDLGHFDLIKTEGIE